MNAGGGLNSKRDNSNKDSKDFVDLHKGNNMSIYEYSEKFTEMLSSPKDMYLNKSEIIERYANGLPSHISTHVINATMLFDAIVMALTLEKILEEESRKQPIFENKERSNHSSWTNLKDCEKCKKKHMGECLKGSDDKLAECGIKEIDKVTCDICHETGHISVMCPMKGTNTIAPINNNHNVLVETSKEQMEWKKRKVEEVFRENILPNDTKSVIMERKGNKFLRRTCYNCHERGHLSNECPKKESNPLTLDAKDCKKVTEFMEGSSSVVVNKVGNDQTGL